MDKSRSTKRTDTENIVDKSGSITRTNLSNKSIRIENPSEIDIYRHNLSFLFCLDKEKVYQVYHQILFVFPVRIK